MKTKRLYYTDSNKLAFQAKIESVSQDEDKFITVLDKTAFYPTSGGQQNDIGLINKIAVIDVIDGDEIQHITESSIGRVGDFVSGQIDFERRQKNKQQHTAQHIISQSFFRLYNLVTMSVHLGESYGNIELDAKGISETQLQKAEYLSNQVISENRLVEVIFAESENIEQYNLRKPPKRSGEIRLISIDDFECSACGGTHVNSTIEIQLVKIISTEKIRGRVAVNFLSGKQAIEDYNLRFKVSNNIANKLTCSVTEIENHFNKMIDQNKTLKRDITTLQKELMPHIIDSYIGKVEIINNINTLFAIENRFDKNLINQFASELAKKCNGIAVLMYNDKLIISCAEETSLHAGEIAKKVSTQTNLKGGGSKKLAQLGGADKNELAKYKLMILEIITQGNNEN